VQRRDRDPGSSEFRAQSVGVRADEGLGSRVASLAGERLEASGGSHVEDRAATARHHLLNRTRRQVDDRFDVDAHLGDFGVDRGVRHRPDGADACVVHQHLDGEPAPLDFVEQVSPGLGIGDVAADDLDANVFQFGGEVLESVLAARDERDAVATGGEFTGEVGTDARRRSGDDGGGGRRGCGKRDLDTNVAPRRPHSASAAIAARISPCPTNPTSVPTPANSAAS